MSTRIFTSESVTEGHPDKLCDQISDAIVDACIADDPRSRCAIETLTKTGLVVVAGELTTKAQDIDFEGIVRKTVTDIGYDSSEKGFDGNTCAVMLAIGKQSPDIAQGVDRGSPETQGAGDQGMVFGYACDETPELMPLPIAMAHKLAEQLAFVRKNVPECEGFRPDGKTQVSVVYEDGRPVSIDTVVVSTQHDEHLTHDEIKRLVWQNVVAPVVDQYGYREETIIDHINPTGRFVIGGPMGDSGLTGRKIIVDTYGGMGRHGGGAFSGKDPTKVDRSAAYYARYIAKHVVAAKLARKCEVQIAYAIGVAEPVSVYVDTFGTACSKKMSGQQWTDEEISEAVMRTFDCRPGMLREELFLYAPIFQATAAYGHFGRKPEAFFAGNGLSTAPIAFFFPWERVMRVDELLGNL